MNRNLLLLALVLGISNLLCAADQPWTPAPGSPERVAICDAAHAYTMEDYVYPGRPPQSFVFKVSRMEVLGNYCSFEALPFARDGSPVDARYIMDIQFEFYLEKSHGKWSVVYDLSGTDIPTVEQMKKMGRGFPRDFPRALLPSYLQKFDRVKS
jgi:hypothetical protein